MAREFAKCRGCGADIEWASLKDKPHPFDVDPSRGGTHELVESEGRTRAVYHPKSERRSGQRLVVSHFATCSKAGEFRGRT